MSSEKVSPQRKRTQKKKRAVSKRKAQQRKINRYIRITGRVAFMIQALLSLILVITIARSRMLPMKYMFLIFVVFAFLSAVTLLMNLRRNRKIRIAGTGISAVMIVLVLVLTTYFNKTMGLLSVGSKALKTDNMVVVVRADDPAQDLEDAREYNYAVHRSASETGGSNAMITDIEEVLSSKINVKEYSSEIEAAKALLDGEVDAAIYNKAYTSVIAESLENDEYEDQVRVLYQYGIETSIDKGDVKVGEPFNILISGIDVYGDISQTSRSDVNIIVTVNPKTKKILLTSTPRDFYVPISGVSGQQRDKLTHAGIYGVDASMRTLEDLYGIDITYYVRVNFNTLVQVVNALDGVDVYIEEGFQPFTDSEIYIESGWQTLDGREALAYCRERYSFADGDNQRGRNQETVLQAIIAKICSPSILLNAGDFMSSLEGAFQTDIPNAKIQELINQQLSDSTPWQVYKQAPTSENYQMQPTYSGGSTPLSVVYPDYYIVKQCSARINIIMEGR